MSRSDVGREAPLRAAIVGLGQVGSRFDEEPGRAVIWSHVGAYLALAQCFDLVGAVEVEASNIAAFRTRCPTVPIYDAIGDLIARHRPEVASICTPTRSHGAVLFQLLENPDLRLIWCEKPLAADLAEARRMVEACAARNVKLMVSFNRHWQPLWQRLRALIRDGAVGTLRSVRVAMPNRLLSIGSHAVDLALMLGGPVDSVSALSLPALDEAGEPAVAALFRYRSGAGGITQVTGFKAQLLVDVEVIGDDGRLWVREDRNAIMIERFETSASFAGYRQLEVGHEEHIEAPAGFSPFIAMAENAAAALAHGTAIECDGEHALEVQRILNLMTAAAR